jgi:phage terminase large subunit
MRYTIPKESFNKAFFPYLKSTARTEIFYGGGGSGKSYFLAQRDILDIMTRKQCNKLIMHKVAASHHYTTFSDLCYVIDNWNKEYFNGTLSREFKINYSKGGEKIICLKTGNEILFGGCKDENELEKVKGIRASNGPITHIRCEEMTNFTPKDIYQLNVVRLRGLSETKKRFTGSMNPILETHFIKKEFIDKAPEGTLFYEHENTDSEALLKNPNLVILKTTHIDNRFYGEEERKELLKLKYIDKYYYDVYVLGNWGILGNIVFHNYELISDSDFPYQEDDLYNVCNGMDFGYVHASTIERCGFHQDHKNNEQEALYVFDEVYGKKWTNLDFINNTKDYFKDNSSIYYCPITADSAEQDRIEEWNRSGFNVIGAKKGPGSLKFGIDYLISIPKIYINKDRCPNLAREIAMFKRKEDKDGNAIDDFVQVNDDTIAALRYGTEYIWSNQIQYYDDSNDGLWSLSDLGL